MQLRKAAAAAPGVRRRRCRQPACRQPAGGAHLCPCSWLRCSRTAKTAAAMKVKTINRSEEAYTRERAQDVQKVRWAGAAAAG